MAHHVQTSALLGTVPHEGVQVPVVSGVHAAHKGDLRSCRINLPAGRLGSAVWSLTLRGGRNVGLLQSLARL